MGNNLSYQSTQPLNLELCFKDIKNIEIIQKLRLNRFLKTLIVYYRRLETQAKQKCIAKLFVKFALNNSLIESNVLKILQMQRYFENFPFINSYCEILNFDKICIALRPYNHLNLYDRMTTRPYLTDGEKHWIVFQMLQILQHIHPIVIHGDIKMENFLITSWGFVLLSDFSFPLKPVYFDRETFISEFNYFFDSSARQSCYIAPERIKTQMIKSIFDLRNKDSFYIENTPLENFPPSFNENSSESLLDNRSDPAMDIFSLGCVLYQLFTDGKILFKPAELLDFSKDVKSQDRVLSLINSDISNIEIRELISSMVSLNPTDRLSATQYIINKSIFPYSFHFLYNIVVKISNPNNSSEFVIFHINTYIDDLIHRINNEPHSFNPHPSFLALINICTTSSIKLKLDNIKIIAFDILLKISKFINSNIIYERILTCFIFFIDDTSSFIRKLILSYIIKLLCVVEKLESIDDFNLFSEYIFPKIFKLQNDPSVCVRIEFGNKIAELCSEAFRYSDMVINCVRSNKEEIGSVKKGVLLELDSINLLIEQICLVLLRDPSSFVQREFINKSFGLIYCKINEVFPIDRGKRENLISHSISLLNNNDDWILRTAFYNNLPKLYSVSGRSMLDLILPILTQGIFDSCEAVVISTINFVKYLINNDGCVFITIYHLIKLCSVFLIHPNPFLRKSVIDLIHICSVSDLDVKYKILISSIVKPFLRSSSLSNFNYFSLEHMKTILLENIPFDVYYPIINRQDVGVFLKSLSEILIDFKNSNKTEFDIEDFTSHKNEITSYFFNILKKNNYCSLEKIQKLVLIKDYFQSYKKEQPFILIPQDNNERGNYIKREGFQSQNLYQSFLLVNSRGNTLVTRSPMFERQSTLKDSPSIGSVDFYSYLIELADKSLNISQKADLNHDNQYIISNYAKQYIKNFKSNSLSEYSKDSKNPYKLILKFKPHSSSINKICAFGNSSYFATASDDCSIMIWSVETLDSSRMKLKFDPFFIYNQMSGRISSIKYLPVYDEEQSFYRVACASYDDSDIQVFDIFYKSNSSSQKTPFHRCIMDLNKDGFVVDMSSNNILAHPLLLAATLNGAVLGYDLRELSCKPSIRFENSINGYLSSLECDPFGCWCAAGTSNGEVLLWDFRFPSMPIKSIQTMNKTPISRMQVNCMDFSKIICSSLHSNTPISIYCLETGKIESSFSIQSSDLVSCTGQYNISIYDSLHVFFSCTDGIVRDWNVDIPKKSSILTRTSKTLAADDQMIYSIRPGSTMSPIETRESVVKDTLSNNKNPKAIQEKYFATDIAFFPNQKVLITGMLDGSINVYK